MDCRKNMPKIVAPKSLRGITMASLKSAKEATPSTDTPVAKKSTGAKRPATPKDAVSLLDADHKKVKKLFKEYNNLAEGLSGSPARRRALADSICLELTVHAQIEEEIFYPAARSTIKDHPLLNEAAVEHASCKDLIAQIKNMDVKEPLFDAKVKVLGEFIDHHVKEERTEMFPKVRKTNLDLDAMRIQLEARGSELRTQLQGENPRNLASEPMASRTTKPAPDRLGGALNK